MEGGYNLLPEHADVCVFFSRLQSKVQQQTSFLFVPYLPISTPRQMSTAPAAGLLNGRKWSHQYLHWVELNG